MARLQIFRSERAIRLTARIWYARLQNRQINILLKEKKRKEKREVKGKAVSTVNFITYMSMERVNDMLIVIKLYPKIVLRFYK